MEKDMVDAISLLKSSEYRFKIVKVIGNKTIMPSEIAEQTSIRLNHVSTFLKELKSHGIVECLNEDNKKGRLYELTELGKNAISKLTNG
ncbi:MarR family transcriptional regulator [Candidatus Woesearchaeota archaeon]|nr:MarR family transcriptional regulator [Candidatus Woesearchaeota archaeon]